VRQAHTALAARGPPASGGDAGIYAGAQGSSGSTTKSFGLPPPLGVPFTLSSLVGAIKPPGPLQGWRFIAAPIALVSMRSGGRLLRPRPVSAMAGTGRSCRRRMANLEGRLLRIEQGPCAEQKGRTPGVDLDVGGPSLAGKEGDPRSLLVPPLCAGLDSAHPVLVALLNTVIQVSSSTGGSISADFNAISPSSLTAWAMPGLCSLRTALNARQQDRSSSTSARLRDASSRARSRCAAVKYPKSYEKKVVFDVFVFCFFFGGCVMNEC